MRGFFFATGLLILCGSLWAADDATPAEEGPSEFSGPTSGLNPLRTNESSRRTIQPRSTSAGKTPDASANEHLNQLRHELYGGDTVRAIAAIEELRTLGPAGAPLLVDAAMRKHRNYAIIESAVRALRDLGPAAVPALAERLRAKNADLGRVDEILRPLGSQGAAATSALTRVVLDASSSLEDRLDAAQLLKGIGPAARDAIPQLIELFEHDEDIPLRAAALKALACMGEVPGGARERLLKCLLDDEQQPELRVAAGTVLVRQRPLVPAVLPALIGLAHSSQDSDVSEAAAKALGQLGPDAADAAPTLVVLLNEGSLSVPAAAATALGQIGLADEKSISALVRWAHENDDITVREAVVKALEKIGPHAISLLITGLDSADPQVRENTLAALAKMGPAAKAAGTPKLLGTLTDSRQADEHLAVVHVLRAIHADPSLATPPLLQILADTGRDIEVRVSAAQALGELGAGAAASVALLSEVLQNLDEAPEVCAAAAIALGQITPKPVPALLRGMRHEDPQVRMAAAVACARQKANVQEAVTILLAQLEDPQNDLIAAESLLAIGPPAIPELAALIRKDEAELHQRTLAAETLGRIGGDAVPILIATMADDNEEIVEAAKSGLQAVGPDKVVPHLLQEIKRRSSAVEREPQTDIHFEVLERMKELILELNSGFGGGGPETASESVGMEGGSLSGIPLDGGGGSGSSPGAFGEPSSAAPEAMPDSHPFVLEPPVPVAPSMDENAKAAAPAAGGLGLKVVKVFYGTNRKPLYTLAQRRRTEWGAFFPMLVAGALTMVLSVFGFAFARSPWKAALAGVGLAITLLLAYPATQRSIKLEQSAVSRPGPVYGIESGSGLEIGTCDVTIPANHRFGEFESPTITHLEIHQDPRKHITVRSVRRTQRDEFYAELKQELADRGSSILVFVHGYNVSFDDAARRTAQMAYDLEFAGAPLFFSWPSQGNWYEYREDEKQVELAINPLKAFLLDVTRSSGARSIHLIAHSMGSRALTAALKEIEAEAGRQTSFNQLVLAAPDIDADVFRQRVAPAITKQAKRVTLYASSNDLALLASRTFNSGDVRAGDASHGLLIVPNIETIDVSDVDSSLLGHSYYGENPTVLTDLKELLLHAQPADSRPALEPVTLDQLKYWIFRHAQTAMQDNSSELQR